MANGHGGRRVGSGKKPTVKRQAVVLGIDGSGRLDGPAVVPPVEQPPAADLSIPPVDLTEPQRAFWRTNAAYAIETGTLVPSTVAGFRELCEQFALKQAIAQRIEIVKPHTKRAEVLLRTYVKLAQRLDATLARFKLTSFGKAVDGAGARKPAANPWAQVGRR